ncbi:VOC family protein [Halostagnicola sp. A-GB9-2]|uniref:VOC family protein n=1 Tax=Halostagnicola sp. A-GB9-2 TaxID=3048066 RepID=UPI0024BFE77B|nr:VOC family protein [Halostagnicola sp. A-GB9-2]MDJ1432550.1 VOC family protein [Halostagnicola sp. A-GB9-2]
MYSHVSLAVRDVERARSFYDAVLDPLDYPRFEEWDWEGGSGYRSQNAESFWIRADDDARPPSSRQHVAFAAPTRDAVDEFHEQALEQGGESDGAPGLRPEYGEHYYAAYVVDPDGNRIEAVRDSAD